jgi:hypothetical protein
MLLILVPLEPTPSSSTNLVTAEQGVDDLPTVVVGQSLVEVSTRLQLSTA